MKLIFTLLLIIITGLKLSASVKGTDTSKITESWGQNSSAIVHHDSLSIPQSSGHNQSLKLFATVSNAYSVRLSSVPVYSDKVDGANSSRVPTHFDNPKMPDSVKAVLKMSHLDSLKMLEALRLSDSLKMIEIAHVDSVKHQLKSIDIDGLKKKLKANKDDALKGPIYFEIATRYMSYDTIKNVDQKAGWQNNALIYTMKALHQYSIYEDTTGLRASFDNLTRIYFDQKKYTQAKWFVLQSNTLSRAKNDVPNIISSLLMLAEIKSQIKDYTLATRDLDEALQLSAKNNYLKTESQVLKSYALLYSRLKNYPKEAMVLKKRDSIEATIHKQEETRMLASANARTLAQKKKLDSLQNKKKVYTSNTRKLYKSSSSRKLASL